MFNSSRFEKSLNSVNVLETLFGLEKSLNFTTLLMPHHLLYNWILLQRKNLACPRCMNLHNKIMLFISVPQMTMYASHLYPWLKIK